MNNRKMKKGIKMSFIRTACENGYTKHDARRVFKGLRRLKWQQNREERKYGNKRNESL